MVYYTNGEETGRDFLYTQCFSVDGGSGGGGSTGGSGGSSGDGNNCRGCGGNGGIMAALQHATPANYYPQNGDKPVAEYPNRCAGTQGLWNLGVANSNAETFGYLNVGLF